MDVDGINPLIGAGITIFVSVMASGGFWNWWMSRDKKEDAKTLLLLGLAHDRIIFLCMNYIDRGWITKDEYEDLEKYLWGPYSTFGGNGLAERVYDEMQSLPILSAPPKEDNK